jgi:uncharacterized protein
MTISMHQISVGVFKRTLGSLSAILDKAQASAESRKIEPDALLLARLAPDMFHLTRQVQAVTDQARASARLAGLEPLKIDNTEKSFAELKARIARTIEYLDTLTPARIDGSEDKQIGVPMGGQTMQVNALDYLTRFITPNFYFHLTAAYAILRHNGVDVGKRDFLGMR